MINYRETENIYSLKVGYTAQIVTLKGNVYVGTITNVDYCDCTVTLANGSAYEVGITGYVERFVHEITINEEDVLTCLSTQPTWTVYKTK